MQTLEATFSYFWDIRFPSKFFILYTSPYRSDTSKAPGPFPIICSAIRWRRKHLLYSNITFILRSCNCRKMTPRKYTRFLYLLSGFPKQPALSKPSLPFLLRICIRRKLCLNLPLKLQKGKALGFCLYYFHKRNFPFWIGLFLLSAVSVKVQNQLNTLLFAYFLNVIFNGKDLRLLVWISFKPATI